ncbi:MAG: alpha/beta hydrolase [Planctomycetota bacterium]|nr:MAG: alpha/beta hydrolase [Planctomycetota bacterium]
MNPKYCSPGTVSWTLLACFVTGSWSSVAAQDPAPRDESASAQVDIGRDVAYRDGNPMWKLDLYLPAVVQSAVRQPRPAIVFVHGGGWRGGDKGRGVFRTLPERYAGLGYVCISVNYRLTTEAPFPACVEDCKCAVRWLRAHAQEYGVDPKRVGGFGISAGAHLVAMLALARADAGLEGDGPYRDVSSELQAAVCVATPADFTIWTRERVPQGLAMLFGTNENLEEIARRASPVTYARRDAPPMLVIHGTADKLVPVDQGRRLVKALQAAGAKDVTYLEIEGAGHGVFNQAAEKTGPAVEAFFARTLGATW